MPFKTLKMQFISDSSSIETGRMRFVIALMSFKKTRQNSFRFFENVRNLLQFHFAFYVLSLYVDHERKDSLQSK